jgi:hypothetical protein
LLIAGVAIAAILAPNQALAQASENAWSFRIVPSEIVLSGPAARQTLLAERWDGELYRGPLEGEVVFASSDPAVAIVEDGVIRPVGDGEATITATAAGADGEAGETAIETVTATVRVERQSEPFAWSFANHVQSVLSKMGCNAGACHGAQAGKNGFKLSLRGYDPAGDHFTITRQMQGRRVTLNEPAHSMVLTKPTGAIAHKGGVRFRNDSIEYRVLSDWIADGAPAPSADDPRLVRLEVLPDHVVLRPGASQQLVVMAHFSDGHREDVTRWAKYTSSNESVGGVDESGLFQVTGYGEGAVTAWYLSQVVNSSVTVPYENKLPNDVFASAPRWTFIDDFVVDKLAALNLPPSPIASDSEFLRRAYLDTIGVLPTVDEAREFLQDPATDKRDRLIDALLDRPEFVDFWAYKWSDLLLVHSDALPAPAMWSYHNWIRDRVAANTPWDEMVRQLVTATGSTLENGAANFFVLHEEPRDLAETTTVAFLGMSINCARCHNHPLEKWTNDQYFGMANLFARVRRKELPGEGNRAVFSASEGDLIQPVSGKVRPPTPLDGEPMPADSGLDRRAYLADWLVSPENPYFARAITNRVWANFFGVGLVESVDDVRLSNPASNELLLGAAAAHLVENEFDLKALMRTVMQSAAYQRTSKPLEGNAAEDRFYSRYYTKRLMSEVLLDAVSQVTDVPSAFPGYPTEWRALQLPDSNVESYFLKTFGRPERVITCECERSAQPSVVQVLHITNGDTFNDKLKADANRLSRRLAEGWTPDQIVEELFLAALARYPTDAELERITAVLAESGDESPRAALEDVYWSVLSSKEFLFNH